MNLKLLDHGQTPIGLLRENHWLDPDRLQKSGDGLRRGVVSSAHHKDPTRLSRFGYDCFASAPGWARMK